MDILECPNCSCSDFTVFTDGHIECSECECLINWVAIEYPLPEEYN